MRRELPRPLLVRVVGAVDHPKLVVVVMVEKGGFGAAGRRAGGEEDLRGVLPPEGLLSTIARNAGLIRAFASRDNTDMTTSPSLARPEIQAELISEALGSASVGFLVWDDHRRYIAANAAACEILGTTLEELLGQEVGGHTVEGLEAIDDGARERLRHRQGRGAAVRRPRAGRGLLRDVHDEDRRHAVHGDGDRPGRCSRAALGHL